MLTKGEIIRKLRELQDPILLKSYQMKLFGLLQDCRRKIGVLAVGARKETQIRNNHFYPEVRKSRVYEIILLSSIILTKILIWGPTVLEKHRVGKCLSATFQSSSSRRKLIFCASFLEK